MAKEKSFRHGEESLRELETIDPFVREIKRNIRWWLWTNVWFWGGLAGGLYGAAKSWTTTVCVVGIIWFLIWVFFYFKTNGKNGRLFATFKEWENIKQMHLLTRQYQNLKNFLCLLIFLDALVWPATFIFKIVFWIFYRVFRFRIRTIRKMIIKGQLILDPKEEELFQDPFYRFLIQEGLYVDSMEVSETGRLPRPKKPKEEEEEIENEQEEQANEEDESGK